MIRNEKETDINDEVAITRSPRERSRLPARISRNNSPEKSGEYRQRSKERTRDKFHKSGLYKLESTSTQDIPLVNTSYNNPIKLPQHQQEQETRGRSRESDKEDIEVEEDDMISLMGFGGFGSTKGKLVKGAKGGGVKKDKKSEYRQYMNREKGFNRALSPNRSK